MSIVTKPILTMKQVRSKEPMRELYAKKSVI